MDSPLHSFDLALTGYLSPEDSSHRAGGSPPIWVRLFVPGNLLERLSIEDLYAGFVLSPERPAPGVCSLEMEVETAITFESKDVNFSPGLSGAGLFGVDPEFLADGCIQVQSERSTLFLDLPARHARLVLQRNLFLPPLPHPRLTGASDQAYEKLGLFWAAEVDYALRVAAALLAFEAGGLLFHGAGVLTHPSGSQKGPTVQLFFGPSGSGKTTTAGFAPPGQVLNDDLVVLLPDSRVYATPFTNPSQVRPNPLCGVLGGLYRLVKDDVVFAQPLRPALALAVLLGCVPVISADPQRAAALVGRVETLLQSVPVYDLHFRRDPSFWAALRT